MLSSSLATKLLLLSLLPASSVGLAWVGVQRSFDAAAKTEAEVLTAISALELANDVASSAEEAILQERGFLVAGSEEFEVAYYEAAALFGTRVAELERLFADAPQQQADVRELAAVFRRWQEEVAVPAIAARRRNELDAGAALVAKTGHGLSVKIDELTTRITRTQGAVVHQRLGEGGRARQMATRWTLAMMLVTLSIAIGGGIAVALQLRRRLGGLEGTAEAIARGDLTRRASDSGGDEIGRLARSFNTMAEQVRERSIDAAGLRKLSELLQACNTVEEAFDVAELVLPSLLPGSSGVVFIINSSRSVLEIAFRFGATMSDGGLPPTGVAAPEDCWAFRRACTHRVADRETTPACRHAGAGDKDYLCIPMLAHGEHVGVLTLSPLPDEQRIARAERLADQIGLAVANLRLRDSLRNQAIRDALTGLYNRRFFEEAAEREVARAKRHGRPVAFLVLDIDHFKRFNDNFGHDAGDFLLREVGQLLRQSVRQTDVACRYGGEEFVLILPESPAEEARKRADHIRESFHRLALSHQGKALGSITVSVGIAAFPEHGHDREVLLRTADAALYSAKAAGRDRVVLAPAVHADASSLGLAAARAS